jgi:dinuclear metal center YbgI/SA1388 family protein
LAYDWDRAGLDIGDPEWNVEKVLVALTITPTIARAAIRGKFDLIVSHHPIIWEPLSKLRLDEPQTRMCVELAAAHIACFSAHTNLDIVSGGVNDALADCLGLVERRPLFPAPHAEMIKLVTFVPESHLGVVRDAVCATGAGVIGEYAHCSFRVAGMGSFKPNASANPYSGKTGRLNEEPEIRFETRVPREKISAAISALKVAHPYEEVAYDLYPIENKNNAIGIGVRGELKKAMTLAEFCEFVRKSLNAESIRYVGDPKKRVLVAAVMGGSGGDEIKNLPEDIDVYVTGEVGYHDALTANDRSVAVIEAGHDGTEKCIIPVLARFLKSRFKSLRVSTHYEPDILRAHIPKVVE